MSAVPDSQIDVVLALIDRIRPLLAGLPCECQGAVLADLVATWLAGHPAALRSEVMHPWLEVVVKLIPVNERAMQS